MMVHSVLDWLAVIKGVIKENPQIDQASVKFKHLVLAEAETAQLTSHQLTMLAVHLGLPLYTRPKNIPEAWSMKLCKKFLSQLYRNPDDSHEYVAVVPHVRGHLPYLIHRTSEGYADAKWFLEVIPELEAIIEMVRQNKIGSPFSGNFNRHVNQLFDNSREGRGMTQGQIQALNLFFEKYVPGLECLCTTCFRVSLPRTGAGERYVPIQLQPDVKGGSKNFVVDKDYEIRLSAAKPESPLPGQQVEYVSHMEKDEKNNAIFATWNKKACVAGFDRRMDQEDTHIPWNVYDFKKFNLRMPVCHCPKKRS